MGGTGEDGFAISLPTPFEKSGAKGTYRRFKFELQSIIRKNELPGYDLTLEVGVGEPLLRMTKLEGAVIEPTKPKLRRQSTRKGKRSNPGRFPLFERNDLTDSRALAWCLAATTSAT